MSTILDGIKRATEEYEYMATFGILRPGFTFDDSSQLFQWRDSATARYVYLKSNGSFDHSEGIPADGKL